MDSSDGHSDASDGSGSGRETRRTNRTGGSRDKGPTWSCSKGTFQDWLWETEPVWDAMGLHKCYTGTNRDEAESADVRVRARYDEENRRLFRVVQSKPGIKMIRKQDFGDGSPFLSVSSAAARRGSPFLSSG